MAIIDKPSDYFNTALWTGNGSTTNITSLDFQPDFTWIKGRSDAIAHVVFDSVRGAGGNKELTPNETYAEGGNSTISYGFLSSFNSDGFTVRNGTSSPNQADYTNKNSSTYASWNWKAGGSASSNSNGSITSSISASSNSGFSIVSYSGTSSNGTIGHGLDSAPKMVIVKALASGRDWMTYHKSVGATKYLFLNATDASASSSGIWNDTDPTSTVVHLGSSNSVNGNGINYIAYCFADTSMSKMGSYSSNSNADGPFVYLGFKPAFLIVKCTTAAEGWAIMDSTREPTNDVSFATLSANTSGSEGSLVIDFLSNGFKPRQVSGQINKSGSHSYIFMAFASNPLVTSTGVPATAR